jgi:hypothetical protein
MRYTVYKFPSLYGTPKTFRFRFTAWLYAKAQLFKVCELEDKKTGEYFAYWA